MTDSRPPVPVLYPSERPPIEYPEPVPAPEPAKYEPEPDDVEVN
ncbi:MAG: hypothetical protein SFV15_16810 [Polyangiaceae bacterium]|nr:hypothetical protein [Polyangiaceae bacterium]